MCLWNIFFRPPNFAVHIFAAPWAMMMKSSSFESPKPYPLTFYLKNSIAALLISVRTCWKVPIYYINVFLVILIWAVLYLFWNASQVLPPYKPHKKRLRTWPQKMHPEKSYLFHYVKFECPFRLVLKYFQLSPTTAHKF